MALRDWLVWETDAHKPAPQTLQGIRLLRDWLTWETPPKPDPEALAERAAIMEHDGGLTRQEAERLAAIK
ncbi:MAG: hypothetical protein PHE17_15565 [Thiothrix sp.]|jgi:hypothetical protein|uniref:hypothetical protein n=1 Tax=Thiothrix sp. TaxID=1032 RepID=UPI0026169194|nr:hypothetical protein [Thiothrix sp.]MDD5394433.1 hypothetical protein [Thiothrix sp.]